MEILSPSPPPSPGPASASASASASAMDSFIHRGAGWHFPRRDNVDARVHVAVGRSPEKTLGLLRWAFRRFACAQVVLVHVHQPSPLIPTLCTILVFQFLLSFFLSWSIYLFMS